VSFQFEKAQLAEQLQRALSAMQGWSPARRLQYLVTLGVKNRKADFTRDFGGEAAPEPDSVAALMAPDSAPLPLIKLLYVLKQADDICLNAPTARSITGEPVVAGEPVIAKLIRVVRDAETGQLVRRTAPVSHELVEADRDSVIGLTLTDRGRRYLDDVLLGRTDDAPVPRAASRGT
jgi:hypothetical protein